MRCLSTSAYQTAVSLIKVSIVMKNFLLMMLTIGSLTSCHHCDKHLSVQTQYLNRSSLASFHIGTPDPQLHFPRIGQQLLIEWKFPKSYLCENCLQIQYTIRFGNRSEIIETIPVEKCNSYYVFDLSSDQFCERGGIRTYKVEVLYQGEIIESWYHQLWVELISVGEDAT